MPKVSVIVPVYGVEKYIVRCAKSLFEQTLDDIEYLFIDDCTPDKSIEILLSVLEDYPQRKSQVTIHRMERNSGQAKVREWGMRNASGLFITHCDSDDWVEKEAYRLMYEKAIHDNADIVVCDYSMTDGDVVYKNNKGYTALDKSDFIRNLLFQIDSWALWNKLFRRNACFKDGIVFPKGNTGEDMVLTIQMLLNGDKVSYVPQSLYNYFYNVNSITHIPSEESRMKNFIQNKDNAELLEKILCNKGLQTKYLDGINYVKWRFKRLIWTMPFDIDRNKMWKETFKEINNWVLLTKNISFSEKIKFVMAYMGLYPRSKKYYERKKV